MTEELFKGLANQGAVGALLAILLFMFVRFFNKMFDAQMERDKASSEFMRQCLAAMQEIKISCVTCRSEILSGETAKLGLMEEKILAAVRETKREIIESARRDNDLSRPHQLPQETPGPVLTRQPYPLASREGNSGR